MDFKIGIPYSLRSYNCWDYVADIRKQAGIKTKLFKVESISSAFKKIGDEMKKLEHGLTLVTAKQDFDIVIVKKGSTYHCGLCIGNDVLHCSRQLKQVVKQTFTEFNKGYESYTLWR